MRRVVITGIGAVTPLGAGIETFFRRWLAGESGIRDGLGRCREFDPSGLLSTKEARRSDRFTQLAVAAAEEALAEAGWSEGPPYPPERVGCVVGTCLGGQHVAEQQHEAWVRKGEKARVWPLTLPVTMHNAAAATVAVRYGLRGPSHAIGSACAAGADAIGTALRLIRAGDADAMLAGGAEGSLTDYSLRTAGAMGAMSPSGTSRPFDARRDGFVMGEGAGMVLLEEEEAAARRGAPVLAELLGYGATIDAHHPTKPAPGGAMAAKAIARALEDAGVGPEAVDYVNAHGTSTPLNDRTETEALKLALGERAGEVPVSSAKSVIGHLIGAAGAVECGVTALALGAGLAPPTVGYEEPEPGLDLDYVPGPPRPLPSRPRRIAISNSFGFGGHNAVLCLGWEER
jgi:3-oxoacyl-[acyl-carrier-protein] synthase II